MSSPNKISTTSKGKKVKRPKTKIDRVKFKEAKLRRDLQSTLKEIKKDTRHARGGKEEALERANRQKLANESSNIRSKLLRLQDEVETREYVRDTQSSRKIQTRIRNRYLNAAKKHHRLLRMTAELEQIKADEEAIRIVAKDERGLEERLAGGYETASRPSAEHRKTQAAITSVMSTGFRHSTQEQDEAAEERAMRLEHVRGSLSLLGVETPREMTEKADGLDHKYDLLREMRNLSHAHMITRHQKNSYYNIIPPYRRKRKKVEHVRRKKVRNFYEDRVNMDKARNIDELSPRKETTEKKPKEVTRFKMTSGQTISLAKMKEFSPPGMDLTTDLTPIEC